MASIDGDLVGTDVNGWIDAAGNALTIFKHDGVGGERRGGSSEKSGSDQQEHGEALAHGGMLGQLSPLKWETHGASGVFAVVSLGVSFGASFGASFGKSMRIALLAGPPTGASRP